MRSAVRGRVMRTVAVTAASVVALGLATAVPAGATGRAPAVPPAAPAGVRAVAGLKDVSVSWTAVAAPTGEIVTRYTATSSVGSKRGRHCTATAPTTGCIIDGLKDGTHYTVEVLAAVGMKKGPYSEAVAVDPGTPLAPVDVGATIATGQSSVSFGEAYDNGSPITSFTATATDVTDAARGGQSASGASSPLVVTGLTDGDTYTFTVTATNARGTGSPSAASAPVVPVPVPGTPTGVSAVPGYGDASVSFTPPVGPAESFTVTAVDLSDAAAGGETSSSGFIPVVVTGLTGGDSYTFTVTASNGPIVGASSTPSAPVVPSTLTTLSVEGSSSAAVAIQQWVGQFATVDPGVAIDWTVNSSVTGLNAFGQNQVDVAASDLPYSAEQSTYYPTQPYQYVPDAASGLALALHLVGNDGQPITDLDLDASVIGKIFLGEITSWDDPSIAALNPQLAGDLPDTRIIPVYRADAGSENYLLSQYLLQEDGTDFTAAQTAFESGNPGQPTAWWPTPAPTVEPGQSAYPGWYADTPVGESGSDNAVNLVSSPSFDGAITYVEVPYASERQLPVADVENGSGAFVPPTSAAVSTALRSATTNSDLSQDLAGVFSSTATGAYPLSSYSYLVTPCAPSLAAAGGATCDGPQTASPLATAEGRALGEFIDYLACNGQSRMAVLGYAPLPPNLIAADIQAVGRLNGATQPPAPTPANCPDLDAGG